MKNIIIVIILLAGFGVGGLYLKKRMNDKEKEESGGTKVIDRKGKKPPKANQPTPPSDKKAPATATADAGAAAPEAKKEEAKAEPADEAPKDEAKKDEASK